MNELANPSTGYSTTRTLIRKIPAEVVDKFSEVKFDIFRKSDNQSFEHGGQRVAGCFKYDSSNLPLVSVITIVFNGVRYIEETIESVINQDYDNVEYIIIDGGSTDGTLDILKKYDSLIDYWVSEPDSGISDAFNKGISLSRGLWVGIINADDWYESGVFSSLVKYDSYDVVYGDMQCWRSGVKSLKYISNHLDLGKTMTLNHPSVFVKRLIYAKYGCFDAEYKVAMDYELLLRLWVNDVSFFCVDHIYSNFRAGGVSDKHQFLGYKEVRRAKLKYRVSSKFCSWLQYMKSYLKGKLSRFIRLSGGEYFLSSYSALFSKYKK